MTGQSTPRAALRTSAVPTPHKPSRASHTSTSPHANGHDRLRDDRGDAARPGRGWRRLCVLLAAICTVQTWRTCHAPTTEPTALTQAAHDRPSLHGDTHPASDPSPPSSEPSPAATADASGFHFHGFVIPGWATWFGPRPGEPLRDYRDRVLPFAQQAIAPHRARVAQLRDAFATSAHLRPQQLADLDRATAETASALEERVLGVVMNNELDPSTFKPMAGVDLARDMLDIVNRGNQHFLDTLDAGQKSTLSQGPFDFADYLMFSTRWEDALGVL